LLYLTICFVGLIIRTIGGTLESFACLLFGRLLEGAGYEVTLGLLEVFICEWCSTKLSFSLAARHCLGQIGYILASILLPYSYNLVKSIRFCFLLSLSVFGSTFFLTWTLFGIDANSEYEEIVPKREKVKGILPGKVWILMITGALMVGISQTFTVILSGYAQRLFGYTNQEGGFLIVTFNPYIDNLYHHYDGCVSVFWYYHRQNSHERHL